MDIPVIILVMMQVLRVKTTIWEVLSNVGRTERKYSELIEITAKMINQNANDSNSNYVAIIEEIENERCVTNEVFMKISTAVASPPSKIHGLAKNAIIFAKNYSNILIKENFDHIHRRGWMIICVTKLYPKGIEFVKEFSKAASYLWAHKFSRMLFIVWIGNELDVFGIRLYDYETCFPNELVKIGRAQNGRIIKSRPFYERVKNLNGCPLRVTTTSEMPYAETYVENNVTRVKGIEGNILNILSKRMNFTAIISDTKKLSGFDSRFNDSKDRLRSNESDLCFSGKKINLHKIEPSVSIMDCKKIWIVPKAGMAAPWMQVIIPFEKSVWLTLAFTLFFVGLVSLSLGQEKASLINMWSLFLGVSIELKKIPENYLVKILFGSWIFFSYVITRSYLAALEGYLTKPNYFREINTVEELVASGISIEGHTIVEKLFCRSNETAISRYICSNFKVRSMEDIFEDIKSKGKVESAFTMKAAIFKNSKFLRDHEVHAMQEVLLTYPTAFLVQKGAPFLDEMNVIITRLIENGFVDLWEKENVIIQEKKKHYPEKLRVEHIMGIMFVAALGYTISIIVFFGECFINYFHFNFKIMKNILRRLK